MAVNAVIVVEMSYLFSCCSLTLSAFKIGFFSNRWVFVGIAGMLILQLLFTYVPLTNQLFSSAPISLYLGWLSAATIANVSSLLVWLGWDGGGLSPVTCAVIMIGVSAVLSLAISFRQRGAIFTGVLVWALIGIWVKQATLPAVVTASAIAIAVSLARLLVSRRINLRPGTARVR